MMPIFPPIFKNIFLGQKKLNCLQTCVSVDHFIWVQNKDEEIL